MCGLLAFMCCTLSAAVVGPNWSMAAGAGAVLSPASIQQRKNANTISNSVSASALHGVHQGEDERHVHARLDRHP